MKPAVVFAVAFVVATAASTGAKIATHKPAPDTTGVDTTAADSGAANPDTIINPSATVAAADSTPAADTLKVRGDSAGVDTAKAAMAHAATAATPVAGAVVQAPMTAAVGPITDSLAAKSGQQMAKVFKSMPPKEAAKVLSHMSDGDVQILLGYIGPREAAAILAELPPERAAALSKAAMRGRGGRGNP